MALVGPAAFGAVLAVPVVAFAFAGNVWLSSADAAPAPVSTASGGQILAGRLMIAHGDDFATGAMAMQSDLRTESGVVPLTIPPSEHSAALALAGSQVRILGSRLGSSFAAMSISAASTPVAATPRGGNAGLETQDAHRGRVDATAGYEHEAESRGRR